MKKLLFLIFTMFIVGMSVKGQQATSQWFDGRVTVKYYNDVLNGGQNGHLVINNNSSYEIDHISIRVTVNVTSQNEYGIKQSKTLVLCDDRITDIPTGQSTIHKTSRGVIKGGPEKEGKTYEYNIEIN